jgi:hypothetical protein
MISHFRRRAPLALALVSAAALNAAVGPTRASDIDNTSNDTPKRAAAAAAAAAVGAAAVPTTGFFAVVRDNGGLARGKGAVSSRRFAAGLGAYEVIFNGPVTGCAFSGTVGNPDANSAAPGEITVQGRFGTSNGVFVTTHNAAGGVADRPFHLVVTC